MNQNIRGQFSTNQKMILSVNNKMEKSFEAFGEFFENGNDPMFIFDLNSHEIINVNQKFVNSRTEFDNALSLFKKNVAVKGFTTGTQFEQEGKVFLFNPIFRKEGKVFIQIVELLKSVNPENLYNKRITTHLFEESFIGKNLLNRLPIGVIHTNKNFESFWSNTKFNSLFGRDIEVGFNFIDAIYVKNISQFWHKIEQLNNEDGQVTFSFVIHNVKHSTEIFIKATAFQVANNDQMQDGYIFLLEDKTENLNFSEEITKQNLALNQINHELDKFLYSVSHNIRGPIASLEGLLKVIEISDVQTVQELKHHLRLNLRLLNSFVSDISNVATNIHTHTKFKEVTLRNVIEKMVLFVENIYEIDPIVHIDIPTTYSVKTDVDRLEIILKSLLKNSFQYRDLGKEHFELTIKVTKSEDFHLIEIFDNGIGVSDKVKPYIFDMFYRGTELSNGNGMGLYNCREILKKIGGTMNIESKDREWTRAKIYLPVNP